MEGNDNRPKRPRIVRGDSTDGSSARNSAERTYSGERRSYNHSSSSHSYNERKSYGPKHGTESGRSYSNPERPYSERKQHGEGRPYSSERKPYGEGRSYADRKPHGEGRPYSSERKSFDEGKPYSSERKSYGEGRSYPDRKPHGEGRPYSSERKPYQKDGKPYGNGQRKSWSGDRGGYGKNDGYGRARSYGDRDRSDRKPYEEDNATAGINRMINSKTVVTNEAYSDNDTVKVPVKEVIRLNKFISNSGICSRREADNYILAGVVTVNGEVVTELGSKVNVYTDDVRFNGERLRGEEKVYIVMNKPKGYVTTAGDPHADKTVMELLTGCQARVFPVGRLDKNTTGVLMFTNDGEIAEKLTHPSYDKKKIYQVSLDSDLRQEDYDKVLAGVELTDGTVAADDLQYIDDTDRRKVGIEIHSGKNRIVRRIFESMGYEVKALDRVYFAGLTKKGIKRGAWRYLTEGEVNILKIGAYR